MSKLAVIYWSGTGNTQAMAEAVAEGAKAAGAAVDLLTCANVGDISAYDAVALGCPAMGAEELEDGEFLPMLESIEGSLVGKKVALFGSYGWGDGEWMRTWETRCAEKGIALATDSVIVNEAPDDEGIEKCKALGTSLTE
ncbi:MAG: flavodoxin [Clostridia bacterium]|nr:flavodoxin [Clostridia bacterium]